MLVGSVIYIFRMQKKPAHPGAKIAGAAGLNLLSISPSVGTVPVPCLASGYARSRLK